MRRRSFLKLAGGGILLAAAGGGWAATRDPGAARAPWLVAGKGERDPRRHALSYALLAPNPHNRQPWIADLGVADEVTLYCDPDRKLPHTDPFDRQITIGLGCFIELAVMAAAASGHRVDVALFPEGEEQTRLDMRPVARLRFAGEKDVPRDPLFDHVLERRSNKEAYDDARQVPADILAAIGRASRTARFGCADEPARVAELRSLAWEAMETELLTPRTLKESIDLVRIGRAEIEANPDGIALPGPLVESMAVAGLVSHDKLLDPASLAFEGQVAALRRQFTTAKAFIWLASPGNGRNDQIAAGRDYVRLNLAANGMGVSMQPFSQALQEYDEVRPHFLRLREMLQIGEDETLQMFARLGYGPAIRGAPRWPLDSRIRS